ncbi:chymotrypsin-like protease CTRL-1 isoform X2 [Denticeps clupeoides]|uniref:chymotrypsin-like protease CTRL-1 isoform X2 n=1 Tax=Denticeps clupeoides TaxID=299321 RepID=UPI0010A53D4E|nr:chymotrypsin-like protease CTRL-1 isoform X2 [Denticeps clupeoides]
MDRFRLLPIAVLIWLPAYKAQTVCGTAPLNNRIVGGTAATDGNWPWQASLHYNGRHICGGTLISSNWLLTACHCIVSTNPIPWTVYLGILSQSGVNPNQQSFSVKTIIPHPQYNNTLYNNDVALIQMASSVTFTPYVQPICLATNSSVFYNGTTCWSTGWGKITSALQTISGTLEEVQIPVVGNSQCSCEYKSVPSVNITSQMICAGTEGKGACQGDSGGPLQCKQGTQWVQAGVTSYGVPCARANFPDVYTRVSEFQTWITSNTADPSVQFMSFNSSGSSGDGNFTCRSNSPIRPYLNPLAFFLLSLFFPVTFTNL